MSKSSVILDTVCASDEKCVAHLMPCSIHHDGPAPVSKYFEPVITKTANHESDILEASFRGRPLQGKILELPSDYVGIVVKKEDDECPSGDTSNDTVDRHEKWSASHKFDKFTYWNWDKQPSANDTVVQALDWLEVATAIHGPVRNK